MDVSSPRNQRVVVFFSRHSPLSNHHLALFKINGVMYLTIEQYLARSRATFAKNDKMVRRIMNSTDPIDNKRCLNIMKDDGEGGSLEGGG